MRFFIGANLPATFLPNAGHDDGLFMNLAQSILSGRWLGSYSQFTLMKGPGYPLFIAVSSLSALSISAAHACFQLFGIAVACWAVWWLSGSRWLASILFVVLALHPAALLPGDLRVIRDQIYWTQVLAVLAGFSVLCLRTPRSSLWSWALAIFTGVMLGWAWLTREEGPWFAPGLAVLLLWGAVLARRELSKLRALVARILVVGIAFGSVNLAFMATNQMVYGSFVGVDVNEPNFVAAYDALVSVESGPRIPHVPMTNKARDAAAAASPTFRPLADQLANVSTTTGWGGISCKVYKDACGEIAGGWFIWALRDAAKANGFYASPKTASESFGRIADEIRGACSSGQLTCRSGLIHFLPVLSTSQWLALPDALGRVAREVWLQNAPRGGAGRPSIDPQSSLAASAAWAMLNYPRLSPIAGSARPWKVAGWYYGPTTSAWPTFSVTSATGAPVESKITRRASPDIAAHFDDPEATNNRFEIEFACPDTCQLAAQSSGSNSPLRLTLSAGHTSAQGNGATLYVDSVDDGTSSAAFHSPAPEFAERFRDLLVTIYQPMLPLLLGLGIGGFLLAVVLAFRRRAAGPLLAVAAAGWVLVATRIFLLALVDITSFPAATSLYTLPATYLAAMSALLSLGAAGMASAPGAVGVRGLQWRIWLRKSFVRSCRG